MKNTVKKRIFQTNAAAVLVTIGIIILLNGILAVGYFESLEREWEDSLETLDPESGIEDILEEWTFHKKSFLVVVTFDVIICGGILITVSMVFTGRLVDCVMKPIQKLEEGAERIRKNNLSEKIDYCGDQEFEVLCNAFNDMQQHLLKEQQKNDKYEQARADMIAGISHDLRTPLTAVRGTIKGLMDGIADSPAQREKFLRVAYQRTEDMNILLNHLLMVSRMETGNIPIHMEEIRLAEWIGDYIEEKRNQTDINTVFSFENRTEGTALVFADKDQLKRIFDNLLGNSMKYVDADPCQIHITMEMKQKNQVTVCFADNGPGVKEEQLAHLFEEFYRCDESRNRKEGNGLGLYIVKYLMQAFGGNAMAENRNGLAIYLNFSGKDME